MSDTNCSICSCPDPTITEIPGAPGENGDNGLDAFTTVATSFVVPAKGALVVINATDASSIGVFDYIAVGLAGYFLVEDVLLNSVAARYLDISSNVRTGFTSTAGQPITVSGPPITSIPVPVVDGGTGLATLTAFGVLVGNGTGNVAPTAAGAAGSFLRGNGAANPTFDALTLPTAFTDNSTGTPSDTLAAGVGVFTLQFPIQLAAMTTSAADLLTDYVLGFAFKILAVSFATTTIGAGAGASQVLNLEIGSTNLTGGAVTLNEAATDTLGELTAGTAVTANNVGTASDTISVEVANGGTVFTAGAGVLLVTVQNMDTANALASLAEHIDDLIAELS